MKILMVCLGNICRSPLAHGIMQHLAKEQGLAWEIDSAGTGGWHIGEPPHHLSQQVATENGIDISRQNARRLQPADFDYYDLILFMDKDNLRDAKAIAGKHWNNTTTALLLDVLPGNAYQHEVPDPYFGGAEGFYEVFQLIHEACEQWLKKLTQGNANQAIS